MRWFYKVLLYCTQLELAIARSTGRNTQSIDALSVEEQRWLKALWQAEQRLTT